MFVLAAALLCAVVPAVVPLRAPPAASLCVVAPALVLPLAPASAPRSVRPPFGADVCGWSEVIAAYWSLLLASWSKGGMRKARARRQTKLSSAIRTKSISLSTSACAWLRQSFRIWCKDRRRKVDLLCSLRQPVRDGRDADGRRRAPPSVRILFYRSWYFYICWRIGEHLSNVFSPNELERQVTVWRFRIVRTDTLIQAISLRKCFAAPPNYNRSLLISTLPATATLSQRGQQRRKIQARPYRCGPQFSTVYANCA